jgi:hypothetical protein
MIGLLLQLKGEAYRVDLQIAHFLIDELDKCQWILRLCSQSVLLIVTNVKGKTWKYHAQSSEISLKK